MLKNVECLIKKIIQGEQVVRVYIIFERIFCEGRMRVIPFKGAERP